MRISGRCVWLFLLLLGFSARADIYRCGGDFGEPSFSQRPCADGSTLVVQQVSPSATAASASGLRPGERAWLEQRKRAGRRHGGVKKPNPRRTQAEARRVAKVQAHRCRSKRRSLDAVKAKLRRGYKAASGEKLRRRRSAYEDYLATFCS